MKKLDKILKKEAYAVAIRKAKTNDPFYIKYPTMHEWWADPFVCKHGLPPYIFNSLRFA